MAVDTRLLSHWQRAQASRVGERDAERWRTPRVDDAYAALINRIEEQRIQLRAVPRPNPKA